MNAIVLAQMSEFLSGVDPDQKFVLVIVAMGCLTIVAIALSGILGGIWCSVRVKQTEADLKRDMLDRGMSAEEIEKVIEAAPRSGFDRWVSDWCKKK